jgi:hypothetical protein
MNDQTYQFARGDEAAPSLADDPRLALFAVSIARQQSAGFKLHLDCRQFACPDCGAAGFNSGWGSIDFTCGASVVGEDFAEPCTTGKAS